MEKKTHVACGNLISLILIQPATVPGLLITLTSSTLGSLLPDVDLKDSTPYRCKKSLPLHQKTTQVRMVVPIRLRQAVLSLFIQYRL